jgi:hypothetical protein
MGRELIDRQLVATRQQVAANMARGQSAPSLGGEQWPRLDVGKSRFDDLPGHSDKRGDARPFVFGARGGQRPGPLLAINLLRAKPTDFTAAGTGQKLKFHDFRGISWKGTAVKPVPQRFNFVHGQHAIARRAEIVASETGSWVHLHNVLR